MTRLRLHLIACRVFERELEALVPSAKTDVNVAFLEMALHEKPGDQLRAALQEAISAVPVSKYDAVALGYGLCNRGLLGLRATVLPVVIPRAHDCLGMLLGSSARYLGELEQEAGTYFQSTGWIQNLRGGEGLRPLAAGMGGGLSASRDELVERYGEENADYLLEAIGSLTQHYRRLAFIRTPVRGCEDCANKACDIASRHGWTFEQLDGDLGWLRRLLDGEWNENEFLVVKPGHRVISRYDGLLIDAERA